MNSRRGLKEFCGIVGVMRTDGPAAELVHRGLFALQHRGQEAAGIVTWGPTQELHHLRGRGLVSECLPVYRVKDLAGNAAIGHVRYSTVTMDRTENIQPFMATTPYGKFAIAHNGNLKNAEALRARLEASGSLLSTTMDTELLVHSLARSGAKSVLYALRDPNGIRPLVLGELKNGWVVTSETCALDALGAVYVRDIAPGELLTVANNRLSSRQLLPPARLAPCVFELVYFARPDSRVFGQGVYGARTRMGERLAQQDMASGGPPPDVVVPVPDSGFPAAVGYARKSGVPLEKAILRSHYVGRTFILPDQDSRSHSIRLKLSVIREAVADKRVLLIDDSIVRGNTSREIVAMVRSAGAREVGMRIASPPLAWPCSLGIDTPDRDELVINQTGSVDGVRRFVGCDSLGYLSLEDLRRATGDQPFCFGCMNGDYPV
jgi:amidophosphoribosyltransferase